MDFWLNTEELNDFLIKKKLLKRFGGIFPIDKIPLKILVNQYLIINTDPSYLPGKHWVVLFSPLNSLPEFFDSMGKCPSSYSYAMVDYLIRNSGRGFVGNNVRLQKEESASCGLFCLYYIYYRMRGYCFEEIVKRFSRNEEQNECEVVKFYYS